MIAPIVIASLTRVSRSVADTTGRREVVADRIRVRRGPAFCGIWKNTRLLNPARTKFTPAVKAAGHLFGNSLVHLRQQDCGGEAPVVHVENSLSDAHASCLQHAAGVTHEAGTMDQERGNLSQGRTDG